MTALFKTPKARKTPEWKPRQVFIPFLIESLEDRIAPASLDGVSWQSVTMDTPILLKAGEGLATGPDGAYLLHIEKGQAMVFITDLNGNGAFDPNEVTGISAGDGLRLTSFVDINGDIVTNLNANGTLTDLDPLAPGNDGRVVLNSKIEAIILRSLTASDSSNPTDHLIPTSYSIHGNIFSGGGFGATNGGLIIDTAGWTALTSKFNGVTSGDYLTGDPYPSVGYIMTGSAVSGQVFSFGVSSDPNFLHGKLATFTPSAGQAGGDIMGVKVGTNASTNTVDPVTGESLYSPIAFQIGGLQTGNGGSGARGGNISNVTLMGDVGGFFAIAGNGGSGDTGGVGGSILNLADLGSFNSLVQIKTGDGGGGFNGKGGDAGALTLGTFSTAGRVDAVLGNGGDGTLGGGNGAGLSQAILTPQEVEVTVPLKIVTTYREAGDIGGTRMVDFNQDGIQDMVYLTVEPNQLAVKLGQEILVGFDPVTFDPIYEYGFYYDSPSQYLAAPVYSTDRSSDVVVGDFNGDGFLDIATASSATNSTDGLYVYLWDPANDSFSLPLRSAIPFWNLGFEANMDLLRSGGAITDLAVGDFTGDGILDIAFVGEYFITKAATVSNQSDLVIMTGTGDGFFYANVKKDPLTQTWTAIPIIELTKVAHSDVLLQATAAEVGNLDSEILVAVTPENSKLTSYDLSTSTYSGGAVEEIASTTGSYKTRTYNTKTDEVEFSASSSKAGPIDFGILDIDGDGFFDLISLNEGGVLVAFQGDAAGSFAQVDGNNGILLTGQFGVLGADSTNLNSSFKGLAIGDFDGDVSTAEFAIYSVGSANTIPLGFYTFSIDGFQQNYNVGQKAPDGDVYGLGFVEFDKPQSLDDSIIAFSSYQGLIGATPGFVIANPTESGIFVGLQVAGGGAAYETSYLPLYQMVFGFQAGRGGNSQLGAGGAGGSFGTGSLSSTEGVVKAGVEFHVPGSDDGFGGVLFRLTAGGGGHGFTTGGNGGSISGIATDFTSGPQSAIYEFYAGDGGNGVQGKGGDGGNISKLNVTRLYLATGGDGGRGTMGGNGGNILGNGVSGLFDATSAGLAAYLVAGNGGLGLKAGGSGGNISNFLMRFDPVLGQGAGLGVLEYKAGKGGNSVAGKGGNGGSISGSSPQSGNFLTGKIDLAAGSGGQGLTGGAGGSITNFSNSSGSPDIPTQVSVMAGRGGAGITGSGGVGGSITTLQVGATGLGSDLQFSRYIAGQGGDSYGATGGTGGSVSGIKVSSQSASLAIAAGAGGNGLTKGGVGGSVFNSSGGAAGSVVSKVVVIAGAGGNAYAYTAATISANPTPQMILKSYGGVNGVGGNGGNINGFMQEGGVNVATDLIAGNGGNLMNYGFGQTKAPSGTGGSISNITLAGHAGDIRSHEAIKSYNDYGTSVASFVTGWLSSTGQGQLTNAIGNVGVIVGTAGRVSVNSNPNTEGYAASGVNNGSVSNFSARNIMSMVAGSVDRISAILSLSNVSVIPGGVLGAYKTASVHAYIPHAANEPMYYAGVNGTGGPTGTAGVGGSLLDGAIVAVAKPAGFTGPRIFPK